MPTIGVMGASDAHLQRLQSANLSMAQSAQDRARNLGAFLATHPANLLTGGGGGLMRAVSSGFSSARNRNGKIIGVIPGPSARQGYPNEFVEILIRTHLPGQDPLAETSRNHINVLTSDAIIALPGGPGTHAEIRLAQFYKRPICVWLDPEEQIDGFPQQHFANSGIPVPSSYRELGAWLERSMTG